MNELWHKIALHLTDKHNREKKLPKQINGTLCSVFSWDEDNPNSLSYTYFDDNGVVGWWQEPNIPLIEAAKELLPYLHDSNPYKAQLIAYVLA